MIYLKVKRNKNSLQSIILVHSYFFSFWGQCKKNDLFMVSHSSIFRRHPRQCLSNKIYSNDDDESCRLDWKTHFIRFRIMTSTQFFIVLYEKKRSGRKRGRIYYHNIFLFFFFHT